jgi:hypothetical protein
MAGKQRTLTETLTGARVLTAAEFRDYGVLDFDCGGAARNVDLPAGSAALAGQEIIYRNSSDAAETVTLRLTSGGTTIATIDQNESALVYCHGTVAPTFTAVVMKIGAT